MTRHVVVIAIALAGCSLKPAYDPQQIKDHKLLDGLTKDTFVLGASTAAYQVEGGLDDNSDWGEFAKKTHPILPEDTTHPKAGRPTVIGGKGAGRSADSWNLWEKDVDALEQLGANGYRMGIDWARLEPQEDVWAPEEVWARYDAMFAKLKEKGIRPMVTVYHFVLPLWLRNKNDGDPTKGGWEYSGCADELGEFAAKVGERWGKDVDLWVTVNEPNVMTTFGYLTGVWPPGYRDQKRMVTAITNLMTGHAKAAKALRAADTVDADGDGKAAQIGIAHHVRHFESASWGALDGAVSGLTDAYFNETVMVANRDGVLRAFIPPAIDTTTPIPDMKDSYDFLGMNYYGRDYVRTDLGDPSLSKQYVPSDRPKNSLGWDVYPEGFERFLVRMGQWKNGAGENLPIYVTENGTSDYTGKERGPYLREHLYALDQARAKGANVKGYFHWSLIDNFEWAEGYTAPFGLFTIDFANDPELVRKPTCGINTFREAARNLGLAPKGDDVPSCPAYEPKR